MVEIYPTLAFTDDIGTLQTLRDRIDELVKALRDSKTELNTAVAENAVEELAQAIDDYTADTIGAALTVLKDEEQAHGVRRHRYTGRIIREAV